MLRGIRTERDRPGRREVLTPAANFRTDTIRAAGELGFMGVEMPEEYGGSGLDSVSYALVMSEISAADGAHGTILGVNNSLYGVPAAPYSAPKSRK